MTNKQIIEMATNEDIQHLLSQIKFENENLICKSEHEIISAEKRIKTWSKQIQDILKGGC